MHHVVVVGGGAGGLELAIRLARREGRGRRTRVTLLDQSPTHIWKPRLHEIAVGLLVPTEEQATFAVQARRHGFEFVLGKMSALDPAARTISVAPVRFPEDLMDRGGTEMLPTRHIEYDFAVLAFGSTVNDFGIRGVKEHCYTLDSVAEAERLHRAVLASATRVGAGEAKGLRVAVVGGGTTGVELAGELRSAASRLPAYRSLMRPGQLEIVIAEEARQLLPGMDHATSEHARSLLENHRVEIHLGAKAAEVSAGALQLADGREITADLIVWASGVQGHAVARSIPGLDIDKGGRIRTDPFLRAVGPDRKPHGTLFCIGDCGACYEDGAKHPVGATAQAAHQQARLLARSLAGQLRGRRPLRFRYKQRGTLVSVGAGRAVGEIPGRGKGAAFHIGGFPATAAYVLLYRMHLVELFGWWHTAALTASSFFRRSALPSVKLDWN